MRMDSGNLLIATGRSRESSRTSKQWRSSGRRSWAQLSVQEDGKIGRGQDGEMTAQSRGRSRTRKVF